jgi:D-aminopeptidase
MLQLGHESVDDDPRIGRPSTSTSEANFERVREIMTSDRNKSVDQIASEVGISVGSCHSILRNVLNMCHVCQHLLP